LPNPKDISSDILDSNRAPRDSELPCLWNVVSPSLALEREELDKHLRKYEGAVCLLRRMPTELLSLIFIYCTPHDRMTLWRLSQVCGRWREILITQPCFWVDITIDLRHTYPSNSIDADSEFRLRTRLQRSQQLPLNEQDEHQRERTFKLMQILLEYCTRWEAFTIEGSEDLLLYLSRIRGRLPLLKELKIELSYDTVDDDIEPELDMFEIAPKLQQLSVNQEHISHPCVVLFPASQLRTYVGTNTWSGHIATLQLATTLVDLSLAGESISTPPAASIISLPHLRRLFITENAFLNCLETPQLRELFCCGVDFHYLRRFVERIPDQLQKLVIWDPVSAANLVTILDAIKTLRVIGIYLPDDGAEDILSLLTMRHEGIDKVPALEHISIALDRLLTTHTLFLDMVESRWQTRTLQVARAYTTFPSQNRDRVEFLQAQGLEISSHSGKYYMLKELTPPHLLIQEC
ncbi:hypothetical protein C8J57DRAFT_1322967, partial [Mycena rebaudengoi]